VEEGDRVRVGQPLAVLEDDQQRIEFERASTTRDNQRREFERAQRLHDQGLVSEEEFETTRREAEEARHTADLAELMLERTVIRASFSGTVLRRHLDVGGTVNDGTPFYDLADLDPLYADVNVPERQIARLSVGQQVRLSADSSGGNTPAIIERIAPLVDPGTGTVKVTLSVNASQDLRPGSFVRVDIVTDTHEQALVVPRSALVAEGRRWHLYRVTEEGRGVQRLEVLRGFEEDNRVEILPGQDAEQGLTEGDEVVVVGASALTDGARIQIMRDDGQSAESDEEAIEDESSRVAA